MRLLLINPKFPESFWSFKWASDKIQTNTRTTNPPLGLATLAALCPEHWDVEIIDENIESIPLNPKADIVGICGMGVQFQRQKELLNFYTKNGYYVVAGGSYASLCPELYESLADTVIAGEAEYIWPEFCKNFESGNPKKLYQENGEVDLTDSPTPRFDLLDLNKYRSVSLQFSRGCPFRCEFCDIIVMFGRKPRTKPLDQVGKELDVLRKLGAESTFFVDDNLIGNKPLAKELLKYLKGYQEKNNFWFNFGTEASLNMAQDDELLDLFRQANFKWVFIGIESPDEESLKETKKFQNIREDLLTSVRKIYTYGMEIYGGFIIGFDNDTVEIFEKQYQFIIQSGIQVAMIGLLTALPKTPLYERLEKEGRLILDTNDTDNTKLSANIIPKQMTYDEMINGYRDLYCRLLEHKNIAKRINNKIKYLKNPISKTNNLTPGRLNLLRRFLVQGFRSNGFRWMFNFLRTIPVSSLKLISLVIQDWVIALSMRDYVERHFIQEFEKSNQLAQRYLNIITNAFHKNLQVSHNQLKDSATHFSINLNGILEKDFFKKAERYLNKVLKNTASSITLHIEDVHETQLKNINHLIRQLSDYGDRVYITVKEELRHLVEIDSSIFNLVLVGETTSNR